MTPGSLQLHVPIFGLCLFTLTRFYAGHTVSSISFRMPGFRCHPLAPKLKTTHHSTLNPQVIIPKITESRDTPPQLLRKPKTLLGTSEASLWRQFERSSGVIKPKWRWMSWRRAFGLDQTSTATFRSDHNSATSTHCGTPGLCRQCAPNDDFGYLVLKPCQSLITILISNCQRQAYVNSYRGVWRRPELWKESNGECTTPPDWRDDW